MLVSRIRLGARSALVSSSANTHQVQPLVIRSLATAAAQNPEAGAAAGDKAKKERDSNKNLSAKLLNRDAKLDEVTDIVLKTPEASFNNVNTAVGIYRLGRLLSNAPEKPSWERTKATQKLMKMAATHSYDPRTVANMCFGAAVGRIDAIDEELAGKFLAHVAKDQEPQIAQYTPKQLTVVGWSFATLQTKEDAFLKRLFGEAAGRAPKDFEVKDLPKLLWAMGRSQVKDQSLVANITKYLNAANLDEMDPNDLSGLVWGIGKLGLKDEALLKKVVEEVIVKRGGFEAGGFSLQSMSRLMWGLAALPYKDERIINSALDVTKRRAKFLRPQNKTDLTFAMWTFGAKDFEKHLAQVEVDAEAKKKKAEQAKKAFLDKLKKRADELAERQTTEKTASPSS